MGIGEKIKHYRQLKGLTQVELSNLLSISQSMVAQIERGSKVPSMPLGKQIADILCVSIEDLYE